MSINIIQHIIKLLKVFLLFVDTHIWKQLYIVQVVPAVQDKEVQKMRVDGKFPQLVQTEIFVADLGRTFYRMCDITRPKRETFDEAALDDLINANQSAGNKDISTVPIEVVERLTLSENVRKRLCELAPKDVPVNDVGFNINVIE